MALVLATVSDTGLGLQPCLLTNGQEMLMQSKQRSLPCPWKGCGIIFKANYQTCLSRDACNVVIAGQLQENYICEAGAATIAKFHANYNISLILQYPCTGVSVQRGEIHEPTFISFIFHQTTFTLSLGIK